MAIDILVFPSGSVDYDTVRWVSQQPEHPYAIPVAFEFLHLVPAWESEVFAAARNIYIMPGPFPSNGQRWLARASQLIRGHVFELVFSPQREVFTTLWANCLLAYGENRADNVSTPHPGD